jgi:hypothetical protein
LEKPYTAFEKIGIALIGIILLPVISIAITLVSIFLILGTVLVVKGFSREPFKCFISIVVLLLLTAATLCVIFVSATCPPILLGSLSILLPMVVGVYGIFTKNEEHLCGVELLQSIGKGDDIDSINYLEVMALVIRFVKKGLTEAREGYSDDGKQEDMMKKFIEFASGNIEAVRNSLTTNVQELQGRNFLPNSLMRLRDIRTLLIQNIEGGEEQGLEDLQLPLLTRIYRILNVSKGREAKITAILETPFIMLASIFPSFGNIFLRWHKGGDNKERKRGLELINSAVRVAREATYSRIPGVNLCMKIFNALKTNYILHRNWNISLSGAKLQLGRGGSSSSVIVDYHISEAIGLSEAIEEFGKVARSDESGYINLPVYVINERPENPQDFGFENTGVSVKGNTLWIGRENGAIVIYAPMELNMEQLPKNYPET